LILQEKLIDIQHGNKEQNKEDLKRQMESYLYERERNYDVNQDLNDKLKDKLRLIEEELDKIQKQKVKNEALRRKQAEEEMR
jgi:hypothetical protein